MDPLRRDFQNPPASHRAAPLWVWNDLMSENQIETQLKELKSHGFGGAFVHPRPGMITDYLSEEWFDRWGFALRTAKALGMKLYIYDENSYPSGFAGGHVSAMLPDCLAEGMTYRVCNLRNDPLPGEPPVAAFACAQKGETLEIGEDLSVYPQAEWARHARKAFVVLPVRAAAAGWTAGFAYTNIMRPEVHRAFMETTYEEYARRFGEDFGDAIPAIFTDEPNIEAPSTPSGTPRVLPLSCWFLNEFEKRNGYSLLKNLLGPHFCAEKPRGTAWPSMWKEAPAHQPAPDAWDLMDFGLDKAPTLKISR